MHVIVGDIASHLTTLNMPLIEKVVRTIVVYVGILAILRLAGKRDLAQLNSFDLVVLLLLSNVVQNAIIGPDNSLLGGLIGAAVLVAINAAVVRLAYRRPWLDRLLGGSETTLVKEGVVDAKALERLALRESELSVAVHRQGASTLAEVETASIGPDGTIEIILWPDDENATKGDMKRVEAMIADLTALIGGGGAPPPSA